MMAFIENTSEQDSNCEQNGKCLKELSKLIRKIRRTLKGKSLGGKDGPLEAQPVPWAWKPSWQEEPSLVFPLKRGPRSHWHSERDLGQRTRVVQSLKEKKKIVYFDKLSNGLFLFSLSCNHWKVVEYTASRVTGQKQAGGESGSRNLPILNINSF